MSRVRFRFNKLGKVRWTSHRDVARMWERALRRAQLSVTYTGGFSPRPKVSFGLALPTGAESVCEYLDVELEHDPTDLDVVSLPARLSPALPVGIDVSAAVVIDDRAESLQQTVTSCRWEIGVAGTSSMSSGWRSAKNSSTAKATSWLGLLSSVRTSKPPMPGSRSTASSALASVAGVCNCRNSGSA